MGREDDTGRDESVGEENAELEERWCGDSVRGRGADDAVGGGVMFIREIPLPIYALISSYLLCAHKFSANSVNL